MIYELRIYECYGGRLPALNKRFSEYTCELFERHGIKNVGYWTNVIGPSNNDLIYLVAFDDMGQRERAWASFQADPEWQQAKAMSEEDGLIVKNVSNQILAATPYSPLK